MIPNDKIARAALVLALAALKMNGLSDVAVFWFGMSTAGALANLKELAVFLAVSAFTLASSRTLPSLDSLDTGKRPPIKITALLSSFTLALIVHANGGIHGLIKPDRHRPAPAATIALIIVSFMVPFHAFAKYHHLRQRYIAAAMLPFAIYTLVSLHGITMAGSWLQIGTSLARYWSGMAIAAAIYITGHLLL